MPYLLWGLALGAALLIAPRVVSHATQTLRAARELRGRRGGRAARETDLERVAAYHHLLEAAGAPGALDDRAWDDLDLDDVFLAVDHTVSEPGRQSLYRLLRTPHATAEPLARVERAVRALAPTGSVARDARAALGRLDDPRAGHLVDLLFGELPRRPRLWWLFPLLTGSAVACLALFAVWPRAAICALVVCLANGLIQLAHRPRVRRFIPALHEIPAFLDAAAALGVLPVDALAEECRVLRDGAARLGTLRRATRWLMFEPGQTNELAASLYGYVNLVFLLDVNAFVFTIDALRAARPELRAMFEAIGAIDAAQSVAAWRDTLPQWTPPEFTGSAKALHVDGLIHLLVADAVPNALGLDGVGALITGSNMSGKSTFIRAVGVGAVLAQTLHTVPAHAWRAPLVSVRTMIGRADSVVEGKSYYLAEAEAVLALVRASEGEGQHLFLLDEIYRGTNTTERVAAGAAVLAYLNRGSHLVIAATHDLELLELLGARVAAYHFREQVVDGVLTFDHRIQPGPSSTRNAIALLTVLGYPASLVADALATIERQGAEGASSVTRG